MTIVATALLALTVVTVAVSVVGVIAFPDPYDKLHYLAPASTVAPVLLVGAVAAHSGWGVSTGRAALVALVLVVTGPVVAHATARSVLTRPGDDAEGREWSVTE
ncbi:MAG TPA: monovalent cation/H(+) antiporter subunit G [Egibacteraceae bacterium]|nr:monovalent cation/H(+) antiporter subunit G [Egibacteraceae bacterium]